MPTATVGFAGANVSDTSVPVPTVKVVVPVMPKDVTEIVADPAFLPRTIPELRTDAMLGFDDFQFNPLTFVAVLPSLNLATA